MAIGRRSVIGSVGALILVAAIAGGAAAAGAGFSASGSFGAGQRAVTSPCTSVNATLVPSYDTGGFYKVDAVDVALTCAAGNFTLAITLATGASTYIERAGAANFATAGNKLVTVAFPSVKVADITNIAAIVYPTSD